jgi:hypothetical protein
MPREARTSVASDHSCRAAFEQEAAEATAVDFARTSRVFRASLTFLLFPPSGAFLPKLLSCAS